MSNPTDIEKLRTYIKSRYTADENGCWIWNLSVGSHGYPQGSVPDVTGQRVSLAHRISYWAFKERPEENLQVDHLCRVKRCVNPEHLELVTQRQNIRRQFGGNENTKLCRRGHDNWFTNTYGYTECRTCKNVSRAKEKA